MILLLGPDCLRPILGGVLLLMILSGTAPATHREAFPPEGVAAGHDSTAASVDAEAGQAGHLSLGGDGEGALQRPARKPRPERQAIVPGLADAPFRLSPGSRRFAHRLSMSPAVGRLGERRLLALRLAYNPNEWLGYEAAIGHNPGESVHGLLHTFNALVRVPVPWRVQPYASLGYGIVMVFPGETHNADPVTENAFAYGGGVELYLRDDVAVRCEGRGVAVIGGARFETGTVIYDYSEITIGLSFYRTLGGRSN
jgi:hypothetical protein